MSIEVRELSSVKGRLFDETGKLVGGINISLDDSEIVTLFDGTYFFSDISPGIHIIVVNVKGYKIITKKIELKENESMNIDIYLEEEMGNGIIYGNVIDSETKEPIKVSGSVYLFNPISNKRVDINPRTGYFEFIKITKGNYDVWVSVLDYEEERKKIIIEDNEKRRADFIIRKKKETEPLWG